jgi:hypothetical protein
METREVFLPAAVLSKCLETWETADDMVLAKAVGEAVERAFWHWRWLMSIRQYACRLVVVQHRDAHGTEMMPHYQLGDLLTLSGWHPERALEEARTLLDNSGDGLTFDLPVDAEWMAEWDEIVDAMEMEEESEDDFSNVELLTTAMLLMDEAHDVYVEELGEDFYIATRGPERNLEQLLDDPYGRWSHETMQIVDRDASAAQVHIFTEQPDGMKTKVPIVYQPTVPDEDADNEMNEDADEGRY